MLRLESKTYNVTYWVNSEHIVMVWKDKDGITRLELSNGKINYPNETPEEIADMMRRTHK